MKILEIWTDGGCRKPNPTVGTGIGGWGFWIPDFFSLKSYGYSGKTTNNIMEMTAIFEALKVIVKATNRGQLNDYDTIVIKSDSAYCINTFNEWIYKWIRKGTLTEKKNWELIYSIFILMKYLRAAEWKIKFNKVPGHCGVLGNETADKLVNIAMDDVISNPVPKSMFGKIDRTASSFADEYFTDDEDKKWFINIFNNI